MEFAEKVVLITGASSGIGASTAIHFSKLSAKLVLVARTESKLRKIALYCEKFKGLKPLVVVADLCNDADVDRIITETIEHFGKLDVLVNNAGISLLGGIKQSSMEGFDQIMGTNLRAAYHLTMLAVPHLISTKGNIVNVSSVAGKKVTKGPLPYSLAKAALDHFTKCVALELASDGVRVNSVNPSLVRTNLMKHTGLTEDQMELYYNRLANEMPLKRAVEADEVAYLIAYLASDKAKSITGVLSVIDGGSLLC